jgi:ATP-dependent RNA helicase DDX49/DBP8
MLALHATLLPQVTARVSAGELVGCYPTHELYPGHMSTHLDLTNYRQVASEKFVFQPSTLDKLIIGIWEQVHSTLNLDPKAIFEQFQVTPNGSSLGMVRQAQTEEPPPGTAVLDTTPSPISDSFSQMNVFCRKVTQASRVCRSIEMIVQARWVELFEEQVQHRSQSRPELSTTKHRKAVFMEACQDFDWSE